MDIRKAFSLLTGDTDNIDTGERSKNEKNIFNFYFIKQND